MIAVLISSALGLVTRRVGRRPPYLFRVVLAIVFGVNVVHDAVYGPQAAWFAELFDTRVRYSGSSLGYQIGVVLAGGFAPLIAVALLVIGGGRPWLIVVYFAVLAAITVAAAYAARETRAERIG